MTNIRHEPAENAELHAAEEAAFAASSVGGSDAELGRLKYSRPPSVSDLRLYSHSLHIVSDPRPEEVYEAMQSIEGTKTPSSPPSSPSSSLSSSSSSSSWPSSSYSLSSIVARRRMSRPSSSCPPIAIRRRLRHLHVVVFVVFVFVVFVVFVVFAVFVVVRRRPSPSVVAVIVYVVAITICTNIAI